MTAFIGRREFITLLGGAAAAWPLSARAKQPERMRRIGVLMPLAADDPEGQARLGAFLQGLQQLGWAIGRNLRVDHRWGAGNVGAMRKYASNWLHSHLTCSWVQAPLPSGHCLKQLARLPLCSYTLSIRSAPGLSAAWRGRAETPPDLFSSNMASAASGLSS